MLGSITQRAPPMSRQKPPAPPTAGKKTPGPVKNASARARLGEDGALWEHVTSSVTPLKGKRKTANNADKAASTKTPEAKKTATPKAAAKAKPQPVATPQRSTRDVASKPALPVAPATTRSSGGFDRSTETKLRKGQLAIEGKIDLHGMTQDEAYRALQRFVTRAHAQHKRTVLVITGKGRVSQGGGVLRRLLPMWVAEADLKSCVLACTPAAIKDGGDGAFYLRLRKHKD